jgi:hypothetical protein
VVDGPEGAPYRPEELLDNVQAAPPPSPPLGNVTLRTFPPPETMYLHAGALHGRDFVSESLGIAVSVPYDFNPFVPRKGAEVDIVVRTQMTAMFGGIHFLFGPLTGDLEAAVIDRLIESNPKYKAPVQKRTSFGMQIPAGLADVLEVELANDIHWQVAFVPACGGETTLVIFATWLGMSGERFSDTWFNRVHLDASSPACRGLTELAGGPK